MNKNRYEQEHIDRRGGFRIKAEIPAKVRLVQPSNAENSQLDVTVITLGAKGVSIVSPHELNIGQELDIYFGMSGLQEPIQFRGKVLWKSNGATNETPKYGVSCDSIEPSVRQAYYSLMADSLLDRKKILDRRTCSNLISELVNFDNRLGHRVVGFLDRKAELNGAERLVVLPPAYGETKTNSLTMAYYLANNGFTVLRYDGTDHIGESEGEIYNTTLSAMGMDLLGAIDYLDKRFGAKEVGIISSSLSGRVAIRAAVGDERIRYIIGLVCVVDLSHTLSAVYRQDLIGGFINGTISGKADILGFEVCDRFLSDAVSEDFHTLEGTINDVRRLKIPLIIFASEHDVWVRPEVLRRVSRVAANPKSSMFIIPDTLHQIYENRNTARSALRQVVASALYCAKNERVTLEQVNEPALREIALQSRAERQRNRFLSKFEKNERIDFWKKYLASFHLIIKCPDFRSLLEMIYDLLGDLEGQRVLDAGCGNGNLAAWWMIAFSKEARRRNGTAQRPHQFTYVGIDYVEEALKDAEDRLRRLAAEMAGDLRETLGIDSCPMPSAFVLCDLNMPLPFIPEYFDSVCCNLVLSYLDAPAFSLKELARVLKPGGRILVTSMKPAADLSAVFENYVAASSGPEDIEEARRLLSNAGFIRHKESEGHFHFYSMEEMQRLLSEAGFCNLQCYLGFADQVNIVTGEKL
jgi:SAM-dependent methyltransferase/pimeloyl-ACP methyl ester carboxylesterase